ncbi:MAG: DUF2238 domain-containing protein [Parcubacteria group bacterium]|nr:DUF2238 domain-containing protein [Parcubacteria group bacterium]
MVASLNQVQLPIQQVYLIFIFVPLTVLSARYLLSKFQLILFTAFNIVWVWSAVNPLFPHAWLLENYLIFFFVPIILLVGLYFKLSNLSYVFLTAFMILHVVGSHYTYAEVPFGFKLQNFLGADRNMYDRLVHFSFGLLLAYPLREMFMVIGRARGFWNYYLPVELTLAFSAIYEIIEWLAAAAVDPEAGLAFLGAQGDIWDAQKDMLLATSGAIITMLITSVYCLVKNPGSWGEIKKSLRPYKQIGE